MGKASSNKKIARAQRAGSGRGAGGSRQRNLVFPFTLTAVVVLGLLLVVFARSDRTSEAQDDPQLDDHWHVAYGISICDGFEPPLIDETDPEGIHSHADAVIHIHPFTANAAGDNAQLSVFLRATGLELDDDSLSLPDGRSVTEGEDDCDGDPAEIRVAYWENADTATETEPEIFTEDFGDIRFLSDRGALTVFFGPADADIPVPESIPNLDNLSDVAPTGPTDTLPGDEPTSTTAGDGGSEAGGDAPADGDPAAEGEPDGSTSTTAAGG